VGSADVEFTHVGSSWENNKVYGLTNFLSVLWYTVAGWCGVGRDEAHAVTMFDGGGQHDGNSSPASAVPTGPGYYMNWIDAANDGHRIQQSGDGRGGPGFYM